MKLYAHQKTIIDEDPEKTGLFLGTGSGKTRIALMLAKGDTLIICPKTQREDRNWEREFKKIVEEQVKDYAQKAKVKTIKDRLTVMSKEEFRRDAGTLPRFNTVIVDEAHTCLGVTPNTRQRARQTIPKASQLFEALDTYLARTKPDRLYLCTATIVKSPFTVWAAMKLLKKRDGSMQDFYQFRSTFYTKLPMPGREVWVPEKDSATKDKLAQYVRSTGYVGRLQDFFDVPDQSFKTDYIELTEAQKRRIRELRAEFPEPIVRVGKRHQVENGVLSGDEFSEGETFPNGKIERILDYALEFPRMVVFAKYRAQIEQIRSACDGAGYKTLVLRGDTQNRGLLIEEANKAEACIFIAQAQISAGWELPEYPVMIFASCTYSFVDRVQGEGRILRANALKKNLYIDLVVKGGIDEAVHESLVHKKDFDERIYIEI